MRDETQRSYLARIDSMINAVAREFSIEYHVVPDLAALQFDGRQTWDGVHVDEVATFALLARLVSESTTLPQFPPAERLTRTARKIAEDPATH